MSNEDEDLARAIALSLQEAARKPASKPLINLDSDEDEDGEESRFQEELRHALQASQAESSQNRRQLRPGSSSQTIQPAGDRSEPSTFLSERAQLERERRERQKRLRPPSTHGSTTGDDDSEDEEPPAKRHQVSTSKSLSTLSNLPSVSSSNSIPVIDQVFWKGELRQTATQYAEPRKDGLPTFRLTDVLGKRSDLAFAIMSSYSLDFPWIYEFFDHSVPVIMVAQPDASGEATIKNVLPNWIRTTPHLRAGHGCQHMKFMLLFYKTGRLRVVVSTANLIAYDWRDMENSVWLQDIPLRSKPTPHDPKASDDFPAALQRMLHGVNVRPALAAMISDNHPDLPLKSIDELRQRWDWSNVKAHLVASIAGKHEGWPRVVQTGHPRLMSAVRKLGMRTGAGKRAKDLVLECQGSSLGIYTTQWLNEFHWSARGESAEDWLDQSKKSREKLPYPPVKVVFPTKATVQESALGEQGGGTIFCRRKQWAAKNFPRTHFYDSKSKGGPVLMHSKMIIAMLHESTVSGKQKQGRLSQVDTEDDSDDDVEVIEPALGWAYVGSHNFTPSAWGTLSGSSFNPILNVSNYELGVVFLLKDAKEAERVACFQRPPKKYTVKDEPWIQEESAYHQT
ncbi:tyrosyl-DNA phosphodiesterase-domain-containing protein [Flammula alnicola]|nr:tyrosyl-DNA phosphodiesterase-domain-containing protein [Flammula alnicola]